MRGTHPKTGNDIFDGGNTPADAGNSDRYFRECFPLQKHPRRCGELYCWSRDRATFAETPPQMRGTRHVGICKVEEFGNTPADAGNSRTLRTWRSSGRKHPRRCGELLTHLVVGIESSETPPQMRGTLNLGDDIGDDFRNTPADAGNSSNEMSMDLGCKKHPRRCGELSNISNFNPIKSLYLEVFAYSRV